MFMNDLDGKMPRRIHLPLTYGALKYLFLKNQNLSKIFYQTKCWQPSPRKVGLEPSPVAFFLSALSNAQQKVRTSHWLSWFYLKFQMSCIKKNNSREHLGGKGETRVMVALCQCGQIRFQLRGRMYQKSYAVGAKDVGKIKMLIIE